MEKVSNKQAICLILTILANNFVLIYSQIAVQTCSSASILNAIYVSIIALLLVGILCILFKQFSGQDILDISHFLGGNFLKAIVGIIFLAYFLLRISVLLRRLADCLQIVYYPYTNIIYIILMFLIAAGIICSFKNHCVYKANSIILPIVLASIVLVFFGNLKNYDFEAIFPLLGYNTYATFFAGLGNLFAFNGIAYLYFLPPKMKTPEKFNKVAFISVLISAIFFVISIASILFMFGNTLDSDFLPLYVAVRYIEFGSFFQRLDSAFLLIWIISFISLLCITTRTCTYIAQKITAISNEKFLAYLVLICIFFITLAIKNSSILEYLENDIFKILFFAITIGASFTILILANIKKIRKRNKTKS